MRKKKTKGNLFQEEKDKKRQYHCDYHKNLSENQKKRRAKHGSNCYITQKIIAGLLNKISSFYQS